MLGVSPLVGQGGMNVTVGSQQQPPSPPPAPKIDRVAPVNNNNSASQYCSLKNAEAVYSYKCHSSKLGQRTHNHLMGCKLEKAPFSEELQRQVHIDALEALYPHSSGVAEHMNTSELSCEIEVSSIDEYTKDMKKRIEGVKRGMARSCAPGYDANAADIMNEFTCSYTGPATDELGRVGTLHGRKVSGRLFSCDMTLDVSDELMEDVKLAAYVKSGGDAANLDIHQFSCNIFSNPYM